MAQRPHVPKFGNWESEDNVPYTVYFDKARKGKSGGKMMNPNDPQENPDMFPKTPKAVPEEPLGRGTYKPAEERRVSREDGDLRQFTDSPARNDNVPRKGDPSAPQRHGGRGSSSGRPTRPSVGSENSIDRSPLHPHHQARVVGRGIGSPALEGKNLYDSSHGAPGRSRLKPSRAESPDRGAPVPRFGDWDEKNPSSAETYTAIFNRVREEKQTGGSPRTPGTDFRPSYNNPRKDQNSNERSTRCCFL